MPEVAKDEYQARWLAYELWLNEQGIVYADVHARTWVTRNFIMRRTP